jgi:hypothetical protein
VPQPAAQPKLDIVHCTLFVPAPLLCLRCPDKERGRENEGEDRYISFQVEKAALVDMEEHNAAVHNTVTHTYIHSNQCDNNLPSASRIKSPNSAEGMWQGDSA